MLWSVPNSGGRGDEDRFFVGIESFLRTKLFSLSSQSYLILKLVLDIFIPIFMERITED